jgi:hypothetical protein
MVTTISKWLLFLFLLMLLFPSALAACMVEGNAPTNDALMQCCQGQYRYTVGTLGPDGTRNHTSYACKKIPDDVVFTKKYFSMIYRSAGILFCIAMILSIIFTAIRIWLAITYIRLKKNDEAVVKSILYYEFWLVTSLIRKERLTTDPQIARQLRLMNWVGALAVAAWVLTLLLFVWTADGLSLVNAYIGK